MKRILPFFLYLYMVLDPLQIYPQQSKIKWLNTEDGLPQNSVKDIIKDKYGFLWLATENGLCRYDGNSFLNFDYLEMSNKRLTPFRGNIEQDSIYVHSNYYEDALLINKRKVLDFSTQNYKKIRNGKRFVNLVKPFYIMYDARIDRNYFINTSSGSFIFSSDSLWFEHKDKNQSKRIDSKLTSEYLFDVFSVNDKVFYINKNQKTVSQITEKGLIEVEANSNFFLKDTKLLWHELTKQCFLIDQNDIYYVSFENHKLKTLPLFQTSNFEALNIISMYYDDLYNKLYLGSLTNGLGIVKQDKFYVVKNGNSYQSTVYYAHTPIGASSIITSQGEVFDSNGFIKQHNFESVKTKYGIISVEGNAFWSQSAKKFYKYSANKNGNYTLKDSINTHKSIKGLFDIGGSAAASYEPIQWSEKQTQSELHFYDGYDLKTIKEKYFFPKIVQDVLMLSKNKALVGTREGLYILDRKTKQKQFVPNSGFLNVRNISKTSSGAIWIMTNGMGIYLFRNNDLIAMPLDEHEALRNAHCILEDSTNTLWISSNNGLFRIQETELLKHAEINENNFYYYFYSTHDGLKTNEFNGGCNPCGNILENGQFTFPSLNGLVFFNPKNVPAYYPKSNLQIERVTIDEEKQAYFEDHIVLENNFFRATIFADIPYYASKENLHIEAFLEGKSTNWERLGDSKAYNITNLRHGNYTLKFRVLTSPNVHYNYKEIAITVKPFYYQTWWFRILILLLLLLTLFLIYFLRFKYLEANKKKMKLIINEKTKHLTTTIKRLNKLKDHLKQESKQQKKLIGTIGHDIATPLKYLTMVTKKISHLSDEELLRNRKLVQSLESSSVELYKFTNALKEYADLYNENIEKSFQKVDLHKIISEKNELFFEIAKNKTIEIKNNIKKGTVIKTKKNVLKVVLHNIIDNALKYTQNGTVEYNFSSCDDSYLISISDTGVGFNKDHIEYYKNLQSEDAADKLLLQKFGIGLHLVIQILPIINGKINFLINKPQGTIVQITIKKP